MQLKERGATVKISTLSIEEKVEELKKETKKFFDRNNNLCSVEAITEFIKEEEIEITTDLDCRENYILAGKSSGEIIHDIVVSSDRETIIETQAMQATRPATRITQPKGCITKGLARILSTHGDCARISRSRIYTKLTCNA